VGFLAFERSRTNMRKNINIFIFIFVLFSLAAYSNCSWAETERHDGNWWVLGSRTEKDNYIIGFFDGMELGNNSSYWNFPKEDSDCFRKVDKSYHEYHKRYFTNVTSGEIVNGLNSFYSDFKKRRILVPDAIWLVVNGIAGMAKEELEKMTESFRKNIKDYKSD
jgi:hypothetical protein